MTAARRRARVALIGYGLGGSTFHAPFIAADPRLDLSVVVTSDAGRQADVAGRYPGAAVLTSLDELPAVRSDVDLAVVTTPNATHAAITRACLDSGLDVVVDKPVAPSADETGELVAQAARSGRRLIPFHNRRWDGDFLTVSALVRSGQLGAVHRFESRFERWRPAVATGGPRAWKREAGPGLGTGMLHDLGTHVVDQAVCLLGRPVSVYAEVDVRRPGAEVDDDTFVALRYEGGLVAHLWVSAVAADLGPRFRILGSAGAYVKHGMDVQEAALGAGERPGGPSWGEEPPEAWGQLALGDPVTTRPEPTRRGAYQAFYAGVADCLLDGKPPPVDPGDAVTTAEIVDAAHRSASEGVVIRFR